MVFIYKTKPNIELDLKSVFLNLKTFHSCLSLVSKNIDCSILYKLLCIKVLIYNLFSQTSIMAVERNINEMLQHQNHIRGSEGRDFNLISDNNNYIQTWSVVQIMVIIGTTVLQVHFVRRLFEVKPGKTRV